MCRLPGPAEGCGGRRQGEAAEKGFLGAVSSKPGPGGNTVEQRVSHKGTKMEENGCRKRSLLFHLFKSK